jgi:hypothetical protein
MFAKDFYHSPSCEPLSFDTTYSLLSGSPTSTALTISLIDFGDGAIEDGGEL